MNGERTWQQGLSASTGRDEPMSAAKDREIKKLKLREKKQRDALASTVQALKSIENECKESIKHYKEQGWKENRSLVKIREDAINALQNVERLKAEFMEEAPGRPAVRLTDIEDDG
jgi:predicted RNase H-like nuclease (RuvC/YqgF family)